MVDDFDEFLKNQKSDANETLEPEFSLEDSDVEFGKCPQCKTETFDLIMIEEYMKLALIESSVEVNYDTVCANCIETYNSQVTYICLLYTSPSPRDQRGSRMPSSA